MNIFVAAKSTKSFIFNVYKAAVRLFHKNYLIGDIVSEVRRLQLADEPDKNKFDEVLFVL